MATSYIIVSNTGSIGDGKKVSLQYDTWQETTPDLFDDVGLNGDAFQMIGPRAGKHEWQFVAQVLDTAPTGYFSFSELAAIINNTTAASRLLKMTTPDGVTYNVLWRTGSIRRGISSQVNGPTVEIYRIPAKVIEQ